MISSYYSYNIHHNMFFLVSHHPDFLITSCIHAFENYVQSIVLYSLLVYHQSVFAEQGIFRIFWILYVITLSHFLDEAFMKRTLPTISY